MASFIFLLSLIVLALSVTPFLPWQVQAVDLASHFALQYFIAAVILALLGLWAGGGFRLLLPAAAAVAINLVLLLPLLGTDSIAAAGGAPRLKILQANVLRDNRDPAALKNLINAEKPDIILLAELNTPFAAMMQELAGEYPYQKSIPSDATSFGMGVLSRQPVDGMTVTTLARADIPSVYFRARLGTSYADVVSVHAANPLRDFPGRNTELSVLQKKVAELGTDQLVIAGDLNASPYCQPFRKMVSSLNLRQARQGRWIMGTYPLALPSSLLRLPIDHVLVGRHIAVVDHRLGPAIGSDHLPTLTTIALAP